MPSKPTANRTDVRPIHAIGELLTTVVAICDAAAAAAVVRDATGDTVVAAHGVAAAAYPMLCRLAADVLTESEAGTGVGLRAVPAAEGLAIAGDSAVSARYAAVRAEVGPPAPGFVVLLVFDPAAGATSPPRWDVVRGVTRHAALLIEARRLRSALRHAETRARLVLDYAPDGILIADERSVYLDANASMCAMLGYTRDELVGRDATHIVAAAETPHIDAALACLNAGAEHSREWIFRRKDGSTFRGEVRAIPTPDGRILATVRDVTAQRRMEHRIRRLVESNAQGVFFWHRDGRITIANDAFLALVGRTRQELERGEISWRSLTPAEYGGVDEQALLEVRERGSCTPYEKVYLRPDGTRVPVLVGAAGFEDDRDEGVSFIIDLTERKRIEARLQRAERIENIGRVAREIAHDLNNQLAPILLSIDLLNELIVGTEVRGVLEGIQASTERAGELVRQWLSFSHGVDARHCTSFDLCATVTALADALRAAFPATVQVVTECPGPIVVAGDEALLQQLLTHLCENARDAMPQGGTLRLRVSTRACPPQDPSSPGHATRCACVEVVDTGVGIPADVREAVFDPFFTTKGAVKGAGLGLPASVAIARAHGGSIDFTSRPGAGTTFTLLLPLDPAAVREQWRAASRQAPPAGAGELILVADDEAPVRDQVARCLEHAGYRVLLAGNGAELLEIFDRHPDAAMVITDLAMPVLDGWEAVRALQGRSRRIPILVSSGHERAADIAEALPEAQVRVLSKPYHTDELLAAVRAALGPTSASAAEEAPPTDRRSESPSRD